MNDIIKLKYKGKSYINYNKILSILENHKFYWLIDSEISNAIIEIKKDTIIWHSGKFLSGDWHYGIFKGGEFYGNWLNGIFESGLFKGKWISGVNLSKK